MSVETEIHSDAHEGTGFSPFDSKSVDRRIVRTKKMLRDALTELIEEEGFDRITVCDLTERADINRGTFYTHYKDKNDLLSQSEDEIIEAIVAIQDGLHAIKLEEVFSCYAENRPLPFVVSLYDYLRENGPFVRALIGPKGDPAFMPRLKELVERNVAENVLNSKYREHMTSLTQYYLAYYTGAQLGIIEHWLDTGMKESSEEMALIALSIMFMRPGDAIEMHAVNQARAAAIVAPTRDASANREISTTHGAPLARMGAGTAASVESQEGRLVANDR